MDIKRVRDITLYFKKESVIMQYRDTQFTCFYSYNSYNKEHFYHFKDKLKHESDMDLNKVFAIALRNRVPSMLTTRASINPLPEKILQPLIHNKGTRIVW